MGRLEFYAWVNQANKELTRDTKQSPGSWANTENDEWWQKARKKRDELRGR